MNFFSALRMALLGLLVIIVLSPAAGASIFKKGLMALTGLWLLTALYLRGDESP
ncbi:hypothetical protein [Pyrobaculum aerophilum]|uniref:hypothetical protein n=1 Tax=Pyrobaculum aerophilum TaxID=13773 RepID=UPI0015F24AA2|nr:hypothetical protein [Pyrobaculum aerophilum]